MEQDQQTLVELDLKKVQWQISGTVSERHLQHPCDIVDRMQPTDGNECQHHGPPPCPGVGVHVDGCQQRVRPKYNGDDLGIRKGKLGIFNLLGIVQVHHSTRELLEDTRK